jgi:hypothetical protein
MNGETRQNEREQEANPAPARSRPGSVRRWRWALHLWRAGRREGKRDYDGAIAALDAAARLEPLWPAERVQRAMLLLKAQRLKEAQQAFAALWKEWQAADDPDRQYLRRYCNAMLGMIRTDASPMALEARAARDIPCHAWLRRRFPLVESED